MSHLAHGADILEATTSDDRGYYYKMAVNTLFPITHELNVGSKTLWGTIATMNEGKEYRFSTDSAEVTQQL